MPASAQEQHNARKSEIRRNRRGAGINVAVAVLLAFAVLVVSNLSSSRLYFHQHFDPAVSGGLSLQTKELLQGCQGDIRMISLFEQSHPFNRPARMLLREYAEAAALVPELHIEARSLNANQDVVEVSDLMRKFPVELNSIIVQYGPEYRVITQYDLDAKPDADVKNWVEDSALTDFAARFSGERACTSAILQLLKPIKANAYFLTGHGEYDTSSHHHITGASSIAHALMLNGIAVRQLNLTQTPKIPEDCDVLVIAGPRTMLTDRETETVTAYLSGGGRILLLIDNIYAGGMAAMLESWGLQTVPPPGSAETIRAPVATMVYGDHQISQRLNNIMTVFAQPCYFETTSTDPALERADKPRISPLVMVPRNRLLPTAPGTLGFDSIAMACELGGMAITGRSHNSKLVVFGDSEFISNAMSQAKFEGNTTLFLSSVEWLIGFRNRIQPETPNNDTLNPGIAPDKGWRSLLIVLAFLIPSALLAAGLFIIMPALRKL